MKFNYKLIFLQLNMSLLIMAKRVPYEYEKYKTNKENFAKTLDKYGVAIIPSILNDKECTNIVSGMWDFFEHITQSWENKMPEITKINPSVLTNSGELLAGF